MNEEKITVPTRRPKDFLSKIYEIISWSILYIDGVDFEGNALKAVHKICV